MSTILGISAFYHDSAAALIVNGALQAAAQEERFTGKKFDEAFPKHSVDFCLKQAGLSDYQVDYVAFYDKPITKFDRLLETYLAFAPQGFGSFSKSIPLWLKEKLYQGREIKKNLRGITRLSKHPILYLSHHESHAASAFYPSPYQEAAILTMDGVGEWDTTCTGIGRSNQIQLLNRIRFPHSLGLLYSAFTYFCGFKVNSGEYKLMGLAPYGEPRFKDAILKHLVHVKEDGSYWLDMKYFNFCQGLTMTNEAFAKLFGVPRRTPESEITSVYRDLAASVQKVTEEIIFKIAHHLHSETKMKNLVLAGGVALNCVANGKLLKEGPFENIWVQPAAGDSGAALGAALFVWHQLLENPRLNNGEDTQRASLLGPKSSQQSIHHFLLRKKAIFHHCQEEKTLLERTADLLQENKVVGWYQGAAEFGPRALGARSILANARSLDAQSVVNLKIKFREGFRPFAPCVLKEKASEWFDVPKGFDSPYMLFVVPVHAERCLPVSKDSASTLAEVLHQKRSEIPAVTHVDYSARIQTVDERHDRLYRLLKEFDSRTGCPVLVNTSFNLSWDPIVNSPEDAYRTFMQSEMDALVLGDFLLLKSEQPLGDFKGFVDPETHRPLEIKEDEVYNPYNGKSYPVEEGIPQFFVPTLRTDEHVSVAPTVKNFYEETPFPNYDDLDNARALIEKARSGLFARLLNDQIDYQASVLEVGCGTGQLTNFLSIAHRSVLGVDLCLNSLKLGNAFKRKNNLKRAHFAQMNLFRPALKEKSFDVVISLGALHHTEDCEGAFYSISQLVKPKGYLVVGLYNAYSRKIVHYPRVAFYKMTGLTPSWMDPHFKDLKNPQRRKAWLKDQYEHPFETCHTVDEVLQWIDNAGLEFINAVPRLDGEALSEKTLLFEPQSRTSAYDRILSQLSSLGDGYREGGFFIMIARKKEEAPC